MTEDIEFTKTCSQKHTYYIEKRMDGTYRASVRDPCGYVTVPTYPKSKQGFPSSAEADRAIREWAKTSGRVLVRTM